LLQLKAKRIILYSKRAIAAGEELCYDYKFPVEEDSEKIACNCRSLQCRRFMN
jgi:SET domain-containing protein